MLIFIFKVKSQTGQTVLECFSDANKVPNEICERTTGFNTEQYTDLCSKLKSMRNSEARTVSQALAVYLYWLRSG